MTQKGLYKGEVCNRDGCKGIIDEKIVEGCCSCHIKPPCSYCTTPKEFCPECGWDAEAEQGLYFDSNVINGDEVGRRYKSSQELFNEIPDGQFGWVIWSSNMSFMIIKGKHLNMTRKEICEKVGCADIQCMANFKYWTNTEFMLSYFTD